MSAQERLTCSMCWYEGFGRQIAHVLLCCWMRKCLDVWESLCETEHLTSSQRELFQARCGVRLESETVIGVQRSLELKSCQVPAFACVQKHLDPGVAGRSDMVVYQTQQLRVMIMETC